MDHFTRIDGRLHGEQVPLERLAERFGTPLYVYSRATLERHWHAFDSALGELPHLVCYAVKANSNLGVLDVLARLGSGFDIVSGGELERVRRAGGDPARVVFSGVGKRADEMAAALAAGIRCFNVESAAELARLNSVAGQAGFTRRAGATAARRALSADALVQFGRGLGFEQAGDRAKAAEAFRAAVRAAPGLSEASAALARVGG